MGRPVHFEILGDDPAKLAGFYSEVLGWEFQSWSGSEEYQQEYWLATTGPEDEAGINGAIMKRHFPQSVINTTLVDSLDETLAQVTASGGKLVFRPNEIPHVGTHAYCEDPEGNLFGVIEELKTNNPPV